MRFHLILSNKILVQQQKLLGQLNWHSFLLKSLLNIWWLHKSFHFRIAIIVTFFLLGKTNNEF